VRRTVARALAAVLVLSALALTLGPPGTTGAAPADQNATDDGPGTAVGGVIGAQGAAVDRAVVVAGFRERFEAAGTPRERARVLATALDRAERHAVTLSERLASLRAARANGSIGPDAFAARARPVAAEARTAAALLDRVRAAAEGVEPAVLREAGVTSTRIRRVADDLEGVVKAGDGGTGTDEDVPAFLGRIDALVATYNEGVGEYDLGVLGAHVTGERVELYVVERDGGTTVLSFHTTADGEVRNLRVGPHPDATVRVTVDESAGRRIVGADDPGSAAARAFLDGEIRIDGVGLYNAIKWTLFDLVISLVRAVVGVVEWVVSVLP
jgi:hypothetical protein